jgi:hypothetical protein
MSLSRLVKSNAATGVLYSDIRAIIDHKGILGTNQDTEPIVLLQIVSTKTNLTLGSGLFSWRFGGLLLGVIFDVVRGFGFGVGFLEEA